MKRNTARPLYLGLTTVLMTAWLAACNGTEVDDQDDGGGDPGSESGGKATGSGGKKGSGGEESSSGGKASSGGKTGTGGESDGVGGGGGDPDLGGADSGGSGSGGDETGSGGDETGSGGGSGGSPPVPAVIARSLEVKLSQVRDVRGLTYDRNGNLYAAGYRLDELGDAWLTVLRILPNGSRDTTFGDDGYAEFNLVERETTTAGEPPVTTVVNDGAENSYGIVELENGDMIVQVNVRQSTGNGTGMWVGLIRIDSDGDIVPSFGTDGIVQTEFGYELGSATPFNDNSWGLALDTASTPGTEKIVVFGFGTAPEASGRTDNDRYITRVLASDGSVDPGFNGGAAFSFNSSGTLSDGGRRGIVLPNGGILSSGYTNLGSTNGNNNPILIQLTPAGLPDPNFGFTAAPASNLLGTTPIPGVAVFNPFAVDGGVAECYATARQSSGRLVTTGYGMATVANGPSTLGYLSSSRQDVVSVGLLATGLDPTFGNSGHFAIQSETTPPPVPLDVLATERFEERGRHIIALADDRLVYAGRYDVKPSLSIVRKNGGLDETVGDQLSGHFLYDGVPQDTTHFFSLAVSNDGRRVAAATDGSATEGVFIAVLRVGDQ
jgi:uncharacterized delta-60 repeat protein